MNGPSTGFAALALASMFLAAGAEGQSRPSSAESGRAPEVRGLWVVRTSLATPELVREMVTTASEAGFNTLLVQVRGRGDAYYASELEPRAEALAGTQPDFDPLALVLELAHARGLRVHAWVNTHLVWGQGALPKSFEHVVHARPDLLAVPRPLGRELHAVDPFDPRYVARLRRWVTENQRTVEGLYSNPAHPGARAHVERIWTDIASRYDVDGLHFDYVRYPSELFDYSAASLERFRDWIGRRTAASRFAELERAAVDDPYAFAEAFPGAWDEFRREQVTTLVRRVHTVVKRIRPDVTVSAAVVPDPADARERRFQDWPAWLREGTLDVVVPMAYDPDPGLFLRRAREATVSAERGARAWIGVGAFRDTPAGVAAKIDVVRGEGAGGFVLFSYDWAARDAHVTGRGTFLEQVARAAFGTGRPGGGAQRR